MKMESASLIRGPQSVLFPQLTLSGTLHVASPRSTTDPTASSPAQCQREICSSSLSAEAPWAQLHRQLSLRTGEM